MSDLTIPGGREKGSPLTTASTESLAWWVERIDVNLREGTCRNPDRDRA
jgi:hypothetical protein